MSENLRLMFEHALPFMVAAANGKGPTLNAPRIIEAVIIAAVLGAGAWLFLVPKLELQFQYMQKELHAVSSKMESVQRDIEQLKIDAAVQAAHHQPVSPRTAPLPTPQP